MLFNMYLVSDKNVRDTSGIATGAAQQRHPMRPRAEDLYQEALAADAEAEAEIHFLEQGLLTVQELALLHHPVQLEIECFDTNGYYDTVFLTVERADYEASHDHLIELLNNFCPFEKWIWVRVEATPDPDQVDWLPARYVNEKFLYDRDLWRQYMLEHRIDELNEGRPLEDMCFDTLKIMVQELFKEDMLGLCAPIQDVDIDTWIDIVPNRRWRFSIWRTPFMPHRNGSPHSSAMDSSVVDALQTLTL